MNKCKGLIVIVGAVLLLTSSVQISRSTDADPALASVTYQFKTTTNDKNFDTAVGVHIICNAHDVGYRECCGADRKIDDWNNNTLSGTYTLPLTELPTKSVLDGCVYRVTGRAKGNDQWDFEAYLHAKYSDSTARDWNFIAGSVNSRGGNISRQDFNLSGSHN